MCATAMPMVSSPPPPSPSPPRYGALAACSAPSPPPHARVPDDAGVKRAVARRRRLRRRLRASVYLDRTRVGLTSYRGKAGWNWCSFGRGAPFPNGVMRAQGMDKWGAEPRTARGAVRFFGWNVDGCGCRRLFSVCFRSPLTHHHLPSSHRRRDDTCVRYMPFPLPPAAGARPISVLSVILILSSVITF